jgi:hypothetical protein
MLALEYVTNNLNESELAESALKWFNVHFEGSIDANDKKWLRKLVKLVNDGRFYNYTCDSCGDSFSHGHPDNWDDFQGVLQDEGGEVMINGKAKNICQYCLSTNPLFF